MTADHRHAELKQLGEILARGRWFFVKVTGRRRTGKTTLIQQALPAGCTATSSSMFAT